LNADVKKAVRTAQTSFPWLLNAKFALMRRYRNARRKPFDVDFNAIGLFPDVEGLLYLDVGANRGQSTDAIMLRSANSRIELFEPNQLLCRNLERLFASSERVSVNCFGLGDETADLPLYVPFYKNWMFDGLASFDEASARRWLQEDRLYFFKEELLTVRELRCKTKRLDELGLAPFFMKLDVQGYEAQALRGGERTLERHRPIVLLEAPPEDESMRFLERLGYRHFSFKDGVFVEGVVETANTYFLTDDKAELVKRHIR
jgi:FkbM family methyltransferase